MTCKQIKQVFKQKVLEIDNVISIKLIYRIELFGHNRKSFH